MQILLAAEWLAVGAAAIWLAARARPAAPPYGRALRTAGIALAAQLALLGALVIALGAAGSTTVLSPGALERTAAVAWTLQFLRVPLVLAAFSAWVSILKAAAGGRARVALVLLLVILSQQHAVGAANFLAGIALLVVLCRLRWTDALRGRARLGLVAALVVLVASLLDFTDHWTLPGPPPSEVTTALSAGGLTVSGALPPRPAEIFRLLDPWNAATRAVTNLVILQTLAALFRMIASVPRALFPRLRLRGLNLERRFAVTYTLVRLVPAAVLVAVIALGVPLALGMHKTVRAREAFRAEILRAVPLADAALESAPWNGPLHRAEAEAALVAARGEQRLPLLESHVIVRRTAWQPSRAPRSAPPSPGEPERPPDPLPPETVATPGTPSALLARSPFAEWPGDTLGGLVESGGNLYLWTARLREGDMNPTLSAEVFVPVDSAFVNRLARDLGADVEVRTTPRTRVARTATTLSLSPGDTTVAVPEIRVRSNASATERATGFWHRPRYLGQETTALGDWLHLPISGPGVVLTYRASGAEIVHALGSAFFLLIDSSIGLPRIALALLVLLIAEIVAVRMGRGITRGVLEDVSALTDAAGRIGRGDFDHRVPVRGKDELASLAGSFNAMAESLRRQRAELVEKERLEEDLAVAREIQARFLPQSPPEVAGVEMAGVSIPSREVGGDLYYFLRLSGGRVGVALGDVSGKSVPAALLMSSVLAGLRAQTQFGADVHEAIANMNRLIVDEIEPGRFVTFFFGVVDPAAGVIRYACAGHNPPLKMSADGACEWLAEAGVPLGILPEAEYRAATAPLAPGDVLVLYSDGISEAEGPPMRREVGREGEGGRGDEGSRADEDLPGADEPEQFGVDRLVETVRALRGRAPAEIVDGTVDAVRRFERGVAQSDDITLVVVKMAGRPAV